MRKIKVEKRDFISEIDTIRAIACLSVVLLHSINFVVGINYAESNNFDKSLITISNLLSFGTTAFIFISGLILAYSYPKKLPSDFYLKRFKYIILPFISVSLLFAFYYGVGDIMNTIKYFTLNLFGLSHWFILVIIQFYLLYPWMLKATNKFSAKSVLTVTFLINVGYLMVFNFIEAPKNLPMASYIWTQGYWSLFLGWIFYFALAFYCGKYYPQFILLLRKYKLWIYTLFIPSIIIVVFLNENTSIAFGSKRIDMILFSLLMIFILFIFANKGTVPRILSIVSNFSFGIYLLHYLFLNILNDIFNSLELYLMFGYFSIILLFILASLMSMISIYLVNKSIIGKYIVGPVKKKSKENSKKFAV